MDPMDDVVAFNVGGGIKLEEEPRPSVVGFGAPDEDPLDLERANEVVDVVLVNVVGRAKEEGAGASGLLGMDPPLDDFD